MALAPRLAAAAAAALLLTGGLAGCSLPGTGSSSGSGPASSTPSSGGEKAAGSAGKASFDNSAKPLVKGTFDSPVAQGAKIDIAVMGLKVRGRLATLTMQLTPHVPPGGPDRLNAYRLNGEHGLGTSLIDPVNLKRYVVVKDSGGKELETDDIFTTMTNDQVTPFYFTFAAPPENVKTVDVQIGTWPTFREIPVER
ncbi:hypothetical protein [Actinomadura mexicana]|uniref:DUF4352 domain-containing protein n=1 Tax=Actinomadura mexicana TaxID=134959 RepID=A0A238WY13_9ACTN|nr:hypothetical protein [Actinomadura mexicana]SNR51402.1 hypothetical protein SAMN06265355_103451 [Actinomadura mexicana]